MGGLVFYGDYVSFGWMKTNKQKNGHSKPSNGHVSWAPNRPFSIAKSSLRHQLHDAGGEGGW